MGFRNIQIKRRLSNSTDSKSGLILYNGVRVNEENQLIHLLTPYFSDPEPSLRRQAVAPFEEGAETIEITSG